MNIGSTWNLLNGLHSQAVLRGLPSGVTSTLESATAALDKDDWTSFDIDRAADLVLTFKDYMEEGDTCSPALHRHAGCVVKELLALVDKAA